MRTKGGIGIVRLQLALAPRAFIVLMEWTQFPSFILALTDAVVSEIFTIILVINSFFLVHLKVHGWV